ncbi:MAG TPA: transcriptional repressor [Anaerolineaceae bacterium]|nr:transcriptional repressor [Anaerolineaceae bacterium]
MQNIDELIEEAQKQGYKITPQRREIFKILVNNDSHPKAEDIYNILKDRMPDVSLATVYNTLNMLKELGMIDAIALFEDDSVRYDPTTKAHDHLYCLHCNRIVDVEKDQDDLGFTEKEISGFQIVKRQVTYYGYCPECRDILKTT